MSINIDVNIFQRAYASISIFILCALVPLILYLLGYSSEHSFNSNAIITTCNITDHYISNEGCTSCFDGYVTVDYYVDNEQYNNLLLVYSDVTNYGELTHKLDTYYPIGSLINCYYDKRNYYNSRIKLYNLTLTIIFISIFMTMSLLSLVIWIFYELYLIIKQKCNMI